MVFVSKKQKFKRDINYFSIFCNFYLNFIIYFIKNHVIYFKKRANKLCSCGKTFAYKNTVLLIIES